MTPFSITSEARDHALALIVHGELDIATSPQLIAALADVREQRPDRTVVDLTACTFIDSSGSRTIAVAGDEFRDAGSHSRCTAASRTVRSAS